MMDGVDDIVGQVLQAGRVAADLVDSPAVRQHWDAPSILVGYRVGGLCGHLARAVETMETYLSAALADSFVVAAGRRRGVLRPGARRPRSDRQ